MPEVFIAIKEAANLLGMSYTGLLSRIQRDPLAYDTTSEPRENGGRPRLLVSVSSLSPRAQQRYWKEQAKPLQNRVADEVTKGKGIPWYVEADYIAYTELHHDEFMEALETLKVYRPLIKMDGEERAEAVKALSAREGISRETVYNRLNALKEALAWAYRKEEETGHGYDLIYLPMALCRKPRDKGRSYALSETQQAKIKSIWFRKGFMENEPPYELAYQIFKEESEAEGLPEPPSFGTVKRFIHQMMKDPLTAQAYYLGAKGARKFEANRVLKQRRNTKALDVLEIVQGDGHTCDVWVQVTDPNGKKRAIRPVLVSWIDTRSRVPMGCVMCEHANSRIIKQSLLKTAYSTPGGVPKYILIDNGKDFTAKDITGQARNKRFQQEDAQIRKEMAGLLDSALKGFLTQLGIEKYTRALPYQAWIKGQQERFYSTMIEGFEKRYASYVGTLTGSRTDAKIPKDIDGMLKRGELPTLEAFQADFEKWLENVYLTRKHRGLKQMQEEWETPIELYNHAPHYVKAAPPEDYALVLQMEAAQASVRKDGITRFNTLYAAPELCRYIGKRVNIRYDRDDLAEFHVYDPETHEKICVARSQELMGMADRVSEDDLKALMRRRNAEKRDTRGRLSDMREAYTFKCENPEATPEVVGGVQLGNQPARRVVSLPQDEEYRREYLREARGAGRKRDKQGQASAAFLAQGEEIFNRMEQA